MIHSVLNTHGVVVTIVERFSGDEVDKAEQVLVSVDDSLEKSFILYQGPPET